jgi:hypothetical protein
VAIWAPHSDGDVLDNRRIVCERHRRRLIGLKKRADPSATSTGGVERSAHRRGGDIE